MRKLTSKQKIYITAMIFGSTESDAAKKAGYVDYDSVASRYKKHKLILLAIEQGKQKSGKVVDEVFVPTSKTGDFAHIPFNKPEDLLEAIKTVMHSENFMSGHRMKAMDMFAKAMGNYIHEDNETPVIIEVYYPDKPEAEQKVRDDFGKPPPPLEMPTYKDEDLDC